MHILFLTENFPPEVNAAATRVYERACYWVQWGHRVTVVTCAPNFPQGEVYAGYENRWFQSEEMDGIRVVRVKTYMARNQGFFRRTLDFLSFMLTGTAAGMIQPRFDLVTATSPQFFSAVAAWMVGCMRWRPFVFELGDLWPASIVELGAMRRGLLIRCLEAAELFLYRRAKAVVALTRAFKEDLVGRRIDAAKIAVIPNGVDVSRYAPQPRDEDLAQQHGLAGKFVVGYIGTHGMAHGLENVVHAAQALQEHDAVRFMLVGTGAAREAVMQEARRLGLRNIVFVPPQPKEAMPRFWSLCDVALIHLKDRALFKTVIPSKLFEAMGMGIPILLVAPRGEASRILEEDGAGIWVAPGDPPALADAVLQLHADEAQRSALARASHQAAALHTREKQARDVLGVYESVLSGSSAMPEAVQ